MGGNAREFSSSLESVLLEFLYSPLIISFNSGNFLVGSTFLVFLGTDLLSLPLGYRWRDLL